jgi:hypothetical protein
MGLVLRHLLFAAPPLLFGLAAGWGFAFSQESCGRMVGWLFAAKCRGTVLEYQLLFQTLGTALGWLVAALLGAWWELRRRGDVQRAHSQPGGSS